MDTPPPLTQDSEVIRKRFLNHEASIQAIGSLYLLGSVVLVGLGVAGLLGYREAEQPMLMGVFFIVFGVAEGWIGWFLRKLDPRSKLPATLLAVLGLIAFPIGTLINAYVLYLLHSAKGKYVYSPEYRAIITATPHIRYKMSIVIWILLGLLVALILLALVATMTSKH